MLWRDVFFNFTTVIDTVSAVRYLSLQEWSWSRPSPRACGWCGMRRRKRRPAVWIDSRGTVAEELTVAAVIDDLLFSFQQGEDQRGGRARAHHPWLQWYGKGIPFYLCQMHSSFCKVKSVDFPKYCTSSIIDFFWYCTSLIIDSLLTDDYRFSQIIED